MPWHISTAVDLNDPRTSRLIRSHSPLFAADSIRAHTWRITVFDQDAPADLSGYSAKIYFKNPTGATESTSGTIDGNAVTFTFPATAYSMEGLHTATARLIGDNRVTLGAMIYTVIFDDPD